MKHILLKSAISLALCAIITQSYANDSTGYVATGGVEYIKNDKIAMQKEDLYISDDVIKVAYEFKNLSSQDITETVLFPLPRVPVLTESDFADTKETFESFGLWVNGKKIKPALHARAFVYPLKDGMTDYDAKPIDVTQKFKQCGLTDSEIMHGWTQKGDLAKIHQKLVDCQDPSLKALMGEYQPSHSDSIYDSLEYAFDWESQVIYSWQQTFKAGAITHIRHEYEPLVGGSVSFDDSQYDSYCVDKTTGQAIKNSTHEFTPYKTISYILTTGANWAKPIKDFKLTIERDSDEVVSFCWAGKGKVQNLGKGKFQIIEKNFVPKKDLDIAFIKVK